MGTPVTPRELAAYHTMMVYREAVSEALKVLAEGHAINDTEECCGCRKLRLTAMGFLTVADTIADTIADVSAELASQR